MKIVYGILIISLILVGLVGFTLYQTSRLESRLISLENELHKFTLPNVCALSLTWQELPPSGLRWFIANCTLFNSGLQTATNVGFTVRVNGYEVNNTGYSIGDILGRQTKMVQYRFTVDLSLSVERVDPEISWTESPTGIPPY